MSLKNLMQDAVTSPKAAATVSAATTGTGMGTILDAIPDDVGKLATLVGIILSVVLIYTHLRKGRLEIQKLRLDIVAAKAALESAEKDAPSEKD